MSSKYDTLDGVISKVAHAYYKDTNLLSKNSWMKIVFTCVTTVGAGVPLLTKNCSCPSLCEPHLHVTVFKMSVQCIHL